MKNELEGDYPGLEIELWNETQLLTNLQDSDAAGIYRYWFEKSEISKELILILMKNQKVGGYHRNILLVCMFKVKCKKIF